MKTRLLALLCLLSTVSLGQQNSTEAVAPKFRLSSPIEGAVYQRNTQTNRGKFKVIGMFTERKYAPNEASQNGQFEDRTRSIQLWLDKLALETGEVVPNTTVPLESPLTGYYGFEATADVPPGWYRLSVRETIRRWSTGQVLQTATTTHKVGIGDVFLIAGQSNAQGIDNGGIADSTKAYDAVRVSNNLFEQWRLVQSPVPSNPEFMPINQQMFITPLTKAYSTDGTGSQFIGPAGKSLWYWARVGQNIAQQYQIPVAFHNVAWGGTTITAYAVTANNSQLTPLGYKTGANPPVRYNAGMPFALLKNAVQFYASVYGLRAVLWMQGETDTQAITDSWGQVGTGNVPLTDIWQVYNITEYKDRLMTTINTARAALSATENLPWVVARTSFYRDVKTTASSLLGKTKLFRP
jgi:hypothetical protein